MKKFGIFLTLALFIGVWIFGIFTNSTTEFVENDLYDEILSRGKLKIGINLSSKPFGFYDNAGNPTGYDVDLAHYITQYILKNPDLMEIVPVTPSNRLMMASAKDVDIVISSITITPQRQEIVDFSIPYDTAGQAVLVKRSSRITSLTDLGGQTVGVIFGTTSEKNMAKMVPTANLRGYKSYDEAYIALKNKEINAITSDDSILKKYSLDDKDVVLLPKRYSKEPYGIAFKKGPTTKKLKENIDFAIKDMKQKGVLTRLHNKWGV